MRLRTFSSTRDAVSALRSSERDRLSELPAVGPPPFSIRINDYVVSKRLGSTFAGAAWRVHPLDLRPVPSLPPCASETTAIDLPFASTTTSIGDRRDGVGPGLRRHLRNSGRVLALYQSVATPKFLVPHGSRRRVRRGRRDCQPNGTATEGYGLYVGVMTAGSTTRYWRSPCGDIPISASVFVGPLRYEPSTPLLAAIRGQGLSEPPMGRCSPLQRTQVLHQPCGVLSPSMNPDYPGNMVHHHKTLQYLAQGSLCLAMSFESTGSGAI